MNESSKRHPKLLSLIFTLNCLSKTSVIRMFVYYFSLKTSWKTYHRSACFPWILNCLFHAFAISIEQYYNTNCLCTTEDDVLADYQFPLLFSRLNYALVLVLMVQVKLCTSVNFFFTHKREREAEVGKTVVWLFYWKKTKTKTKKRTLGWHFAYPQNFWKILKWQPQNVPATFAANSSQITDVYINKPICWQYLAHVVSTDSSCVWLVLSVGTSFKAS